jgi:hypothetical protein
VSFATISSGRRTAVDDHRDGPMRTERAKRCPDPLRRSAAIAGHVGPFHGREPRRPSSGCHPVATAGCHRPESPIVQTAGESRDPVCRPATGDHWSPCGTEAGFRASGLYLNIPANAACSNNCSGRTASATQSAQVLAIRQVAQLRGAEPSCEAHDDSCRRHPEYPNRSTRRFTHNSCMISRRPSRLTRGSRERNSDAS